MPRQRLKVAGVPVIWNVTPADGLESLVALNGEPLRSA
jgi:hypothetical protein